MAIWNFAVVKSQDYETLLRLPKNDFPDTFDKFSNLQASKKAKYLLEWRGITAIETEIDVNEFIGDCNLTNSNYTLDSLNDFARKKSKREK